MLDASTYAGGPHDSLGAWYDSWTDFTGDLQNIGGLAQSGGAVVSGVVQTVKDVRGVGGVSVSSVTPGVVGAVATDLANNIRNAASGAVASNAQRNAADSAALFGSSSVSTTTLLELGGVALIGYVLLKSLGGRRRRSRR